MQQHNDFTMWGIIFSHRVNLKLALQFQVDRDDIVTSNCLFMDLLSCHTY